MATAIAASARRVSCTFALTQTVLTASGGPSVSLLDPGALRAVLLYIPVSAFAQSLLSACAAIVLRSAPGAVVVIVWSAVFTAVAMIRVLAHPASVLALGMSRGSRTTVRCSWSGSPLTSSNSMAVAIRPISSPG